jgi:nitrile hydratase subunit beta
MSIKPIGPHDVTGQAATAIDPTSKDLAWWEKRVDALYKLLADDKRQILNVDELRFAIESLGPDIYHSHSYYERWVLAIRDLLIEKSILTEEELQQRVDEVKRQSIQ